MLGRYVNRAVDAQARWSKPFGEFNHRWLGALFHPIRPIQNFRTGRGSATRSMPSSRTFPSAP